MRRVILMLLCIMCGRSFVCFSQNSLNLTSVFQHLFDNFEEDLAEEVIADMLDNPLKVNSAKLITLEKFPLFTPFMAASLYDHIKNTGPILSIHELSVLPGFDREIAKALEPFIDFTIGRLRSRSKSTILIRGSTVLNREEGYKPISKEEWLKRLNSRYIGPPGRLYGQYKYQIPGFIQGSFTTEKDPGELHFDHIGFSLMIQGVRLLKKVVVGDFTARFGQGLTIWNAPSMFSLSVANSVLKQEYGLTPYSSTDENSPFRGVGVTLEDRKNSLSLFVSYKGLDARIIEGGFTSLLTTGLHNTKTTLERKKSLKRGEVGANYSHNADNIKIGVSAIGYRYSHNYAGTNPLHIERERALGRWGVNIGADMLAVIKSFRLFTEVSYSPMKNYAVVGGVVWRKSYNLDISLALKESWALYHSPFESSYADGINALINYRGRLNFNFRGWFQWLHKKNSYRVGVLWTKEYGDKFAISNRIDYRDNRLATRMHFDYRVGEILELSARGEITLKQQVGWMGYGEVLLNIPIIATRLSARVSYFRVPHWDLRIYAYERDVLYGLSIPALYGNGFRSYINIHIKLCRWMEIWLKGSLWHYTDRNSIGEGPAAVEGPSKYDIKGELRFRF